MDMMTIILVFLLKSLSNSPASLPQSQDLQLPKSILTTEPESEPEGLAVIVSAFGQRIGEGCQGPGSGLAVGMKSGSSDYDFSSLTSCAKRLKNQVPEAADETAATLTANANIPYQVIIGTVDAIRKSDDGQELFPDINFGVPK
jgi:hypothetical protein